MTNRLSPAVATLIAGLLLLTSCAGTTTAEATVTFTGDACSYAGASTFDLDTELTIEAVNETTGSFGFGVSKIPDGTTLADIETRGTLELINAEGSDSGGILRPGSVESRELIVVLEESGTWVFGCFTLTPGTIQTDEDYPAAVVEVS